MVFIRIQYFLRPSELMSSAFFFQAEDGIRGGHVTGVQTCALPISRLRRTAFDTRSSASSWPTTRSRRSEERRVGKECRSRWTPKTLKKKCTNKNKEHYIGLYCDKM